MVFTGERAERSRDGAVFFLEPRSPLQSRRREENFWLRLGEEVTEAAALADLPFEAAAVFLKKAKNTPGSAVCLCRRPAEDSGTERT